MGASAVLIKIGAEPSFEFRASRMHAPSVLQGMLEPTAKYLGRGEVHRYRGASRDVGNGLAGGRRAQQCSALVYQRDRAHANSIHHDSP
jgi:hypothetical protein